MSTVLQIKDSDKLDFLHQNHTNGKNPNPLSTDKNSFPTELTTETRTFVVGGRGMNGSPWRRKCLSLRKLYLQAKQYALAQTTCERGELPEPNDENRNRWHARNSKVSKKIYIPMMERDFIQLEEKMKENISQMQNTKLRIENLRIENQSLRGSEKSVCYTFQLLLSSIKEKRLLERAFQT